MGRQSGNKRHTLQRRHPKLPVPPHLVAHSVLGQPSFLRRHCGPYWQRYECFCESFFTIARWKHTVTEICHCQAWCYSHCQAYC